MSFEIDCTQMIKLVYSFDQNALTQPTYIDPVSCKNSSFWQNHPTETFYKENIFCSKSSFRLKRIRVTNVYNANVQYMYFNYETQEKYKASFSRGIE